MFQIEKNAPLPARKSPGEIDALVATMEIGDSVLTKYKTSGAASVFTLAARRQKRAFTFNARVEGSGSRVWRVA